MTTWPKDELSRIAEPDDLHISPFREDGRTSVVVDDALYVRAYNGQSSRWYQAAMRQKAGRISVAGITKEVTFEPADAYHAKYKGSSYLSPMTGTRARSTTVKVTPR